MSDIAQHVAKPPTTDKSSAPWWSLSTEAIAARLGTNLVTGLSSIEAKKRLLIFGPNLMAAAMGPSIFKLFFRQFTNVLMLLLAAAAGLSVFLGDWTDALFIIAIIVINGIIGFVQEFRSERAVQALKKLAEPFTWVRRDHQKKKSLASELVPGDVIEIESGSLVPADCRIVFSAETQVDESSLTGESLPIEKHGDVLPQETPLADRHNMLHMGTAIVQGRAIALVIATGLRTELGQISSMLSTAGESRTPLEKRLAKFGYLLGAGVILASVSIFLLGFFQTPDPSSHQLAHLFMIAISLAVAAVPEGLPAITTIALALGSQRMARRKALVRQLGAVETLGSVSVICSDKTGTLTQGKMSVAELLSLDPSAPDEKLLFSAAACSSVPHISTKGSPAIFYNPTEAAIFKALEKCGHKAPSAVSGERIKEFPFSSDRKRMATVYELPNGGFQVFVKGAFELVLTHAKFRFHHGATEQLKEADRQSLFTRAEELTRKGRRLLGVATAVHQDLPETLEVAEKDLVFLGVIAFVDPPRPEAKLALKQCREAGIQCIMITGDHAETARAIATEIDFLSAAKKVVSGAGLDAMSDQQLRDEISGIAIFARTTPVHKLRIVNALQANGHTVAMTGDGVNDAPALKQADIGIAMGKAGTEVSKEASRVVLADDNFATIVAAIEEGRIVYDNIQKFIRYLITGNLIEVLAIVVAFAAGWPIPLLPTQLLWINLVSDGLPALALAYEPAEENVLKCHPRSASEGILTKGSTTRILITAIMAAAACLTVYYAALPADWTQWMSEDELSSARTAAFLAIGLVHPWYALSIRSKVYPGLHLLHLASNWRLLAAVLGGTVLQFAMVYIKPLAQIFHMRPIPPHFVVLACLAGASAFALFEIEKWWRRMTR